MALEDAVCLAQMVDAHDDLAAAFEAYRARRVVRTARVQLGSRALGEHVYHPQGVRAQGRDAVLRGLSAEDYYDRLEWLYGASG